MSKRRRFSGQEKVRILREHLEGFKEKSKKTIDYIKRYYNKTLIIKQNIERVI